MFTHQFKYAFQTLFRNKMLIFWTFLFPIVLGFFFHLAFKDIESSEMLDIIDIAIVDNEAFQSDEMLKQAMKSLSKEGDENQLFRIEYVTKEEAEKHLEERRIAGYIELKDEKANVIVKESGIEATVLKSVVDEVIQTGIQIENIVMNEVATNPPVTQENMNAYYEEVYQNAQNIVMNAKSNIKDISRSNLSYTMIEYYTLIAMACLYGGILGMVAINQILPNMSSQGKRSSIAPVRKGKMILASLLASYAVQLIGLALLFLFLLFVIHVDFGSKVGYIILLALVGSFTGLSLGIACATLIKSNEATKTGILLAITMFGCFLSGMMGITMKYIVDKNVPILNKINPASMITDGFYALYYYDTTSRYFWNIISLCIFSSILLILVCTVLRRQKYDNI